MNATQTRNSSPQSEVFSYVPSETTLPATREQVSVIQRHLAETISSKTPTLDKLFNQLVAEWHKDIQYSSSLDDIFLHPSYQRIIGLGARAVPLILARLQRETDHWDWALRAITGQDLHFTDEQQGDLEAMRQAWLHWAMTSGMRF
jgi:hypothetical protein